jgi:hypothetical protein
MFLTARKTLESSKTGLGEPALIASQAAPKIDLNFAQSTSLRV